MSLVAAVVGNSTSTSTIRHEFVNRCVPDSANVRKSLARLMKTQSLAAGAFPMPCFRVVRQAECG